MSTNTPQDEKIEAAKNIMKQNGYTRKEVSTNDMRYEYMLDNWFKKNLRNTELNA